MIQSSGLTSVFIGFDSAWSIKNEGAIACIRRGEDGSLQFEPPKIVSFDAARDFIQTHSIDVRLSIIALDQPTIVKCDSGSRPVDKIAASIVGKYKGGVQPASRKKVELFGDGAPVWKFLDGIGHTQDPMTQPVEGRYLIEVFPQLNILGLFPVFIEQGKCPKYNPGRRKTFLRKDWKQLCNLLEEYGTRHTILGLPEYAREAFAALPEPPDEAKPESRPLPHKHNQDRLDAAICAIMAYEWATGGNDGRKMAVLGDMQTGYMIHFEAKSAEL